MKKKLLQIAIFISLVVPFALVYRSTTVSAAIPQPTFAVDVLNHPCDATSGGTGAHANCGVCNNPDAGGTPSFCDAVASPTNNPIFGPKGILTLVIQILAVLMGIIAVVTILISGVRMITAMGDSNSVSNAKRAIQYAVIALVIAVLAQVLVSFILSKIST